jgi:glycosyltransferase 2 family protein
MPSRDRLVALASRGFALAGARRVRAAAQLLLVAGLVFAAVRLRSLWHDSHVDLARADWPALAGAVLLSAAGVVASGFAWLEILRRLGVRPRAHWAGVVFQAQLAKYVPGMLWQYAGRAALARGRGLPLRTVAVSLPVELGASLAAAGILSSLLLGPWGLLPAAALLGAAALGARPAGQTVPQPVRAGAAVVPLFAAILFVLGAGFWLTARGLFGAPAGDLLPYVGAFTAAWVVGVVAVYAPGGVGVREAILVAILHGRLGAADALVLALVSRGVLVAVDVLAAGAGVLLLRRHPAPEADAPADEPRALAGS